ncbi:MAG: phage tail tube protein [Luteimonas sp.]
MSNELRSQGTEIWVANGAMTVLKIGNVTGYGDFGKQSSDIVTSNLDSTAVEKIPGLPDVGDVGLTINLDPGSPAHQFLETNAGNGTRYSWLIGYSDGTVPPTAAANAVVAPAATARSTQRFLAGVKSFRESIGLDGVVSVNVALAISGGVSRVWKTA